MIDPASELRQSLLDRAYDGRLDRRRLLGWMMAAGIAGTVPAVELDRALAAGATQRNARANLASTYDYVIIGAGAAGCVIAAELTRAGAEVLLVEAGGTDDSPQVTTPNIWFTNLGGPRDWRFKASPSPHVNGREIPVAMGHVLGGGTSINAMLWVRGLAADYDDWAYNGCVGWGFDDVLPLFKQLEDWEGGANAWRGAGGPLHICTAKSPHPTASAFIDASRQMGIPILDDLNGPMREGAGYVNMTIAPDGSRDSAARAFLRPVLGQGNLTLLLDTPATKLHISGTRCTGVQLMLDGAARDIAARKEVILCAGGIHSAKLLLLSGIGDPAQLKQLGIETKQALPGVGKNYQDHPLLFGVVYSYKGVMPPHATANNVVEAAAFARSDKAKHLPDIKLVLMQLPILSDRLREIYGPQPADSFTICPALLRPTTTGTVRLKSADWQDAPILSSGYLATDADLEATVNCIEQCRELGHQAGFDAVRERELVPAAKLGKAELRDFARNAAISFGHPVGTCKMGTDEDAVVDPTLRVHGIEALRVCDSSVMPRIVTGPTAAASHLIGLKASTMILASR